MTPPWLTFDPQRARRVFANVLTAKKCDSYTRIQQDEALIALHRILQDPTNYADEIGRYSVSVARSVAFGKRVQTASDPFATQIQTLMLQFAQAMTPGKYLFESIPLLRRLPRFMQPWLPELEGFRDYEHDFSLRHYREALEYAEKHPDRPCVARDIRREMRETGEEDDLQGATVCMEILGTGSETTTTSLLFVVLACLAHPEVQKKAHEELDRVVGQDRFPTWEDEPNLPYIRAIIKEQHRWRTIAPMSMHGPFVRYLAKVLANFCVFDQVFRIGRRARKCITGIASPRIRSSGSIHGMTSHHSFSAILSWELCTPTTYPE